MKVCNDQKIRRSDDQKIRLGWSKNGNADDAERKDLLGSMKSFFDSYSIAFQIFYHTARKIHVDHPFLHAVWWIPILPYR